MLAGCKRNMKWVVEEGSYKYQLQPCDKYRKEDCNSYEYFFLNLIGLCINQIALFSSSYILVPSNIGCVVNIS